MGKMRQARPEEFEAEMKEFYPNVPLMTFEEAIKYLEEKCKFDEYSGWSIRYYGYGEHLTYWSGDGTFIDFGIDEDTKITWNKFKQVIIESAMAKKDFETKVDEMVK